MSVTLLGWRRTVAALYADVRAASDPAEGWAAWRAGRDRLFATHPDSPVGDQATFGGLRYAPYDPAFRFVVPVQAAPPEHIAVPTATDGVVPFDRIGRVELPGLGALEVWWLGSYGGGLFLPFRDATCGRESYGGGRYLLDTVKGADLGGDAERLVVDLNFAYNPSCAYDEAWACPLPPPGNVLRAAVHAGELAPAG
ncbi:MAG TPA: DUF1684 domain-containing protein [Cryptosporangiaceae bacterium]|nr:DUF1684 domain-containing protein [Cryptosporangiaceae bacterium]